MSSRAEFPRKFRFLFEPHRYKIAYGGRGGAKSWAFARALLILSTQRKMRILCCREIQKSIADSVHWLLKDQIRRMGIKHLFVVTDTAIRCTNGSEFIFAGLLRNVDSVKSMESIDVAWIEEAQSVSERSLSILIPTIRKTGSEIWMSFNPYLDTDPVYTRFIKNEHPEAKVVKVGWQDNPWFTNIMRREKDALYASDPDAANHVWGGDTLKNTVAQVLRGRWLVESFEPESTWDGPYFGVDWGFGTTPTVMIKCWVNMRVSAKTVEMDLYIEHEAQGMGVDLVDTPALFDEIPSARDYIARADSARPETISHMNQNGYRRIVACQKGPGSVEDGVEFLRSFKRIIIHPRCPLAREQAKLYSYKVDRLTGDPLPFLEKKHDDVWDATRYALEPAIRRFIKKRKEKSEKKSRDRYAEAAKRQSQKDGSWSVA